MNEMTFYDLKHSQALTPSLSSQVVRELGRRIVAGFYQPGDLIEDEGALAERYRVSRSVIRDAVKVLVGKGLVEARRGIGTRIRPRSQWSLLDDDVLAWHQSAPPDADFLRQLLDIRLAIEPKAARWACQWAGQEDLERVSASCRRMENERGSVEDFVVADALFHKSILQATHNDFVASMEGIIFSALLISIRLTNREPRDNRQSIPFHRAVCDAIFARDGDQAEQAMENLLADARSRVEERLVIP